MNECPQCGRKIRYSGLCLQCQKENKEKAILSLDEAGLAEKTAEVLESGFDEDLCRLLIRLRDINTEKLAEAAWEQREFDCPEVFKDASDELTALMTAELMRDDLDCLSADEIQSCLAYRGGETVENVFRELEKNPRDWRSKLHVDPSYYANYGGWTFGEDGKTIKTAFDKCFRIVESTAEEKAQSPIKLAMPAEGICSDCGCKYINILELDGSDERLSFLGIDGKVTVKCCPNCRPFDDGGFCRYDGKGGAEIIPSKGYGSPVEDNDWVDELAEKNFALGGEVSVYFPCDWDTGSAVGGFPFWIDDCIIKTCPDCGKLMTYLAQIGGDVLGYEGNTYVEICKDCRVAVSFYQQT